MNWFRIVEVWKYAFGFKSRFEGPVINSAPMVSERDSEEKMKFTEFDQSDVDNIIDRVMDSKMTSEDCQHYTDAFGHAYYGGGTCSISIIVPNGDAAAVTSSINSA